eukprot:gb/GFBE01055208.1/.p1 GENE.gb/GFBE01055208.1/~~gb/GFBE01055208.1/.p1  ORF type:complete len:215 (+),score=58.18 gb/GFBE01055208.1/:1-645(+)
MAAAGEANEALQAAGFAPIVGGEDEGADDEDGSLCPPPCAMVCGGGLQRLQTQLGDRRAVPMELWSFEKGSESAGVGFVCVHDVMNSVFYANLSCSQGEASGAAAGRSTKSAITTLLDLAEACSTSKITLGLIAEHAGCADLVCSLLYLGFQVVPTRKCPLPNAVLLLEFDIGPPLPGGVNNPSSDYTCSGTSECSTSAEDTNSRHDSESPDSD